MKKYSVSNVPLKRLYFWNDTLPFHKKWSCLRKLVLGVFSENTFFFFENIVEQRQIQHIIYNKKGCIHFCPKTPPSLKWSYP